MSTLTPISTPSRSFAVSPTQWIHAFAFTPDTDSSTRLRDDSQHLTADGNEDALPTRFRPRTCSRASSGGLHKGCDAVSGEGNSSMVPTMRKRRGRTSEASLSVRTADDLSATTENDHNHAKVPVPSHSYASLTPRSGRVVLDAVEIAHRKRPWSCMPNDGCPTENTYSTFSHYPSPPVSRVSDHGISSRSTTNPGKHGTPNTTLPLKGSKYFTPASILPTQSVPEYIPAATPPSSPTLTIPTYNESSDIRHPLLDASLDNREDNSVEPGYVPQWDNNPRLFSDLMVMLRRLKPILIQESVRDDPWKVLIAVRLLNVTTGKAAIPIFCRLISRWPTPQDLARAPQGELIELLRPLGLYNKRANWLQDISEHFVEDQRGRNYPKTPLTSFLSEEHAAPTFPPLHYPGVGPYALDSLRIFCMRDKDAWKYVMPGDKELVRYLRWRWAVEEGKIWYPQMGVIGDANVPYLITLVDELATHYDNAIGGEGYMYHFCNDLCEVLTGNMTEQKIQ